MQSPKSRKVQFPYGNLLGVLFLLLLESVVQIFYLDERQTDYKSQIATINSTALALQAVIVLASLTQIILHQKFNEWKFMVFTYFLILALQVLYQCAHHLTNDREVRALSLSKNLILQTIAFRLYTWQSVARAILSLNAIGYFLAVIFRMFLSISWNTFTFLQWLAVAGAILYISCAGRIGEEVHLKHKLSQPDKIPEAQNLQAPVNANKQENQPHIFAEIKMQQSITEKASSKQIIKMDSVSVFINNGLQNQNPCPENLQKSPHQAISETDEPTRIQIDMQKYQLDSYIEKSRKLMQQQQIYFGDQFQLLNAIAKPLAIISSDNQILYQNRQFKNQILGAEMGIKFPNKILKMVNILVKPEQQPSTASESAKVAKNFQTFHPNQLAGQANSINLTNNSNQNQNPSSGDGQSNPKKKIWAPVISQAMVYTDISYSLPVDQIVPTKQTQALASPRFMHQSLNHSSAILTDYYRLTDLTNQTYSAILEMINEYQKNDDFLFSRYPNLLQQIRAMFDQFDENPNQDNPQQFIVGQARYKMICSHQVRMKPRNGIVAQYFLITLTSCIYRNQKSVILIFDNLTLYHRLSGLENQLDQTKKNIYHIAHELRSPLNTLIGFLDQLLEKENQNEESFKIMSSCKNNAKIQLNYIQDLLDMAQNQAGSFKVQIETFNLQHIIYEAEDMIKMKLQEKGVEFKLVYDANVPVMISSDPSRIRQILINLMVNASKFTEQGSIMVTVGIRTDPPPEQHLQDIKISVKDTGIGISQDNLKILGQAFGKIEDAQSKKLNPKGVGLGLMISNNIAKHLNICEEPIRVFSELNKGSEFTFFVTNYVNTESQIPNEIQEDLPCRQAQGNQFIIPTKEFKTLENQYRQNPLQQLPVKYCQSIKNYTIIEKNCKCTKILIIDDEQANIVFLGEMLKGLAEYDGATSGKKALSMVIQRQESNSCCPSYQIIFMDIEMPIQDGYKTSQQIIQHLQKFNLSTNIIGLSGHDVNFIQKNCIEAGMSLALTKPLKKEVLIEILKNCRIL